MQTPINELRLDRRQKMLGKNMGTEKTRAWAVLALVVPLAQSRSLAVQTCIQSVPNLHSTGFDPLFTGSIPAFRLYPASLRLCVEFPTAFLNHRLPITNYQLLITNRQSPVRNRPKLHPSPAKSTQVHYKASSPNSRYHDTDFAAVGTHICLP
jgi:hypothetical protein